MLGLYESYVAVPAQPLAAPAPADGASVAPEPSPC